ncbi:hypothetical protein RvY_09524 [Ramazzottius varieornatus]|uniref:UFSP1/2/DUB catalytic domain-containing protein n=1 Tax=Ramazzottius varieornatus TaxID=947166 RepID=A0A1D1V9N0_RAMVA|nr:hypothetical protein RvY_09524 [Ramazzottius varieornatus]
MDIYLAQSLEQHLKRHSSGRQYGILYGIRPLQLDDTMIGLMCTFVDEECLQSSEALRHHLDTNNMILPTGLHVIGLVDFTKSPHNYRDGLSEAQYEYLRLLHEFCESQDQQVARVVVLVEDSDEIPRRKLQFRGFVWKSLTDPTVQSSPVIWKSYEAIHQDLAYFRLNAVIDSAITPTNSRHGLAKALEQKLQDLQVDNKNDYAYGLHGDNSVILLPSTPATVVANPNMGATSPTTSIKDFLTAYSKREAKEAKPLKSDGISSLSDVTQGFLPESLVEMNLFSNATDARSLHGSSPLLTIGEGATQLIRLSIDCFIVCSKSKTLAKLVEVVEDAKRKQLNSILYFIRRWALFYSKPDELQVPMPFHVINGPNLLTLYTAPNDEVLDEFLGEIYDRFGYTPELPVLRKECSLRSRLVMSKRNILDIGDKLVTGPNSKFLKESSDWELTKVLGSYTYHHYKQDRFDDDGWGCAYRSLQTLFSWFKLQGFTKAPVPHHEQIQRLLVEIKDREKSLIGSKQWIGAMEISRTLEQLLGIQCRIVYVQAGRDLGTAFAALKSHFETEGTPVMIGGGVYAHTIGGVAVNRTTGEVKALVVDPHYVGEDNVDLVFKKNGVAWRTPEFWDQNAFFNLCCPLRPRLSPSTRA